MKTKFEVGHRSTPTHGSVNHKSKGCMSYDNKESLQTVEEENILKEHLRCLESGITSEPSSKGSYISGIKGKKNGVSGSY